MHIQCFYLQLQSYSKLVLCDKAGIVVIITFWHSVVALVDISYETYVY